MTTSPALATAIADFAVAGHRVRDAIGQYEQWQREKSIAKTGAIARIMREPNALSRKPHTIQTAEATVESDDAYHDYLLDGLRLQLAKHKAEEAYEAARLIALYHATHTPQA